jgi:hypothetical protein
VPFEHLNSTPDPSETVTRYIFEAGHFSRTTARVKAKALEPSSIDNLASVFRIIELSDEQIWELGQLFVEPRRGRSTLARADIPISNIIRQGLRVDPDEPPPRHANIAGWPGEKDANMSKAQELAADARLVVRNISPSHAKI